MYLKEYFVSGKNDIIIFYEFMSIENKKYFNLGYVI